MIGWSNQNYTLTFPGISEEGAKETGMQVNTPEINWELASKIQFLFSSQEFKQPWQ